MAAPCACVSFALAAVALRRSAILRFTLIAAGLFAFGVSLASWRTHHVHSPYLTEPVSFAQVTGRVEAISPTPKGSKLLLGDVTISKLAPKETPVHVSITLRNYNPDLVTGQIISIRAGLFPPPQPALPNGFDFGRYFYFQQVGAVGYGIGKPEIKTLKESGAWDFQIWFSEFRHRLTESIRSHFRELAGAVAAAFVTGEVRTIPDNVNDDMRIAGLYHLLAVSGMNLSVVAGLAFFTLRFLLAAIPGVAVRYPIKKWAALLALIVSYMYLRVSGSPVSAERAFFMVALVFIAILLDREPSPMRSVAIAAFCIILYEPEAVLTASLQLSFSATAALIASYEWGIGWLAAQGREQGIGFKRIAYYFAAVIAASCIAWFATEPFIIYHFNQFSSYSLIANTIAEPLVSFILMPLVIAGVLLLPFHLAWLAFTPMQYGVELLLKIADGVAHLPHAMWIIPSPTDWGFTLAAVGAIWIYFWKTSWRWFGLFAVVAGMSTAWLYVPPDIFVSSDGKHVAVRTNDGQMVMVKGRAVNLTAQQWARASTQEELANKKTSDIECDAEGCIVHSMRHAIAMPRHMDALADDCSMADIVIATEVVSRDQCKPPLLIDKTMLDEGGAVALWFKDGKIVAKHARPEQGSRPWVTQETPEPDEEEKPD